MEGGLLLDVVVGKGIPVLKLLPTKIRRCWSEGIPAGMSAGILSAGEVTGIGDVAPRL